MRHVVEIRSRTDTGSEVLARFVWTGQGRVGFEAVARNAKAAFLDPVARGIQVGDDVVTLDDGLAFLEALRFEYHGSYLWATARSQEPDPEQLQ